MDARTDSYYLGIDVGSTTVKVVLLGVEGEVKYSAYRRHNTETLLTLQDILQDAQAKLGEVKFHLQMTGSAGLGISEKYNFSFIQEVIASAEVVHKRYPHVRTLLDIGGEDAKVIFFGSNGRPDIRMNGACAGGTGAFIDQMATLLNIPVSDFNILAEQAEAIHPIASRCGVFAKTDVQNLLSRDVSKPEIAASVFHAVVLQTLATLARGRSLEPVILFAGGPLTFFPALRTAFIKALDLPPKSCLEVDNPELIPAHGAALAAAELPAQYSLSHLMAILEARPPSQSLQGRLTPLFEHDQGFSSWEAARTQAKVESVDIRDVAGNRCFLGIDSGSTTTKVVLVDEQGRVFFDYYAPNNGNAIRAAQEGLQQVRESFAGQTDPPRIARSTVTGYGEDLIRAAFGCDEGTVETLAHYRAARAFDPQVSFILDIGGQDMKAIFVQDGYVQRIEINEACSSGCGTFIETFARSLGHTVSDFAHMACNAGEPCDLGTRCTVFMNSRVKQALREGAEVGEISAGLAYSVIKNALHKVLNLTDTAVLGDHIVVQGGSFRNPAIHRAMEQVLGKPVVCPDKAEHMGAFGAALIARDTYMRTSEGTGLGVALDDLASVGDYQKRIINCRGCENQCTITKLTFPNTNIFYTGNRCERIFSNHGKKVEPGANMYARANELLFERPTQTAAAPRLTIGIPRALNFFENYPFWNTLFVESGIRVRLSDQSKHALFEKGAGTVMSENICFPAKLLHGHIFNLLDAGVDRIFYPMVFYEKSEFADAINCYNCPIVSGYPDVVRSAIDPQGKYGVPFDQPAVTFQDTKLLKKTCRDYLSELGVDRSTFERAFKLALEAQDEYKQELRQLGAEIIERAKAEKRLAVILAGRPYHVDPLINHKIPEILADMGVDVLTVDSIPWKEGQSLENQMVLTQWAYLNRIFHAARWTGKQKGVELAQLNSFGCGPDAFALDEVKGVLSEYGKNHTVLRIDEITSTGSARLRLRSMLEAFNEKNDPLQDDEPQHIVARKTTRLYRKTDHDKVIIVPEFSRFCTPPIIRPGYDMGYHIEVLPSPDNESVQVGLKYTNNEICYPGIIVIGDAIKALQSGVYDPDQVIVGSWETGGQCRASNISCLMKKALVSAGYEHIPVVTLSTRLKSFNPQPEFKFNLIEYLYKALLGMVYSDGISALYHATAVRERTRGDADALADKYMIPFESGAVPLARAPIIQKLREAVTEFNSLSVDRERRPQVGIVGEIYVKYNTFVNNNLVQWLMDQDVEVVLPPLLSFFTGSFVGLKAGVQARIRRPELLHILASLGKRLVRSVIHEADAALRDFSFYRPHKDDDETARTAQSIVHLTHQYGEGWLLSGEIGEYVKEGVQNVICLQPFGCIANHVIAKGVAQRLQERYQDLNLLYLDLDAGISEVNYFNRLHFFLEQAKATA